MSIFDSATPLDREVTAMTANLYWEVPTDPANFVRAHIDDLDLVAIVVRDSNDTLEGITSYNPRSSCNAVRHSGENVDGRGKKGAPREIVTVDLKNSTPASAIFFAARVLRGAGLHHSQNSRLTVCADTTVLNSAGINDDANMKNMHSAILGALLRSPEGIWHYVPQMITFARGYLDDILPVAHDTYIRMMRG